MINELEKERDDEVYEDSFYEDEEEELEDEDSFEESEESDEESENSNASSISVGFVCEDCDYRWDDYIEKSSNELEEEEEIDAICPMCGSVNVSQI